MCLGRRHVSILTIHSCDSGLSNLSRPPAVLDRCGVFGGSLHYGQLFDQFLGSGLLLSTSSTKIPNPRESDSPCSRILGVLAVATSIDFYDTGGWHCFIRTAMGSNASL
jgi:hypothetical protein